MSYLRRREAPYHPPLPLRPQRPRSCGWLARPGMLSASALQLPRWDAPSALDVGVRDSDGPFGATSRSRRALSVALPARRRDHERRDASAVKEPADRLTLTAFCGATSRRRSLGTRRRARCLAPLGVEAVAPRRHDGDHGSLLDGGVAPRARRAAAQKCSSSGGKRVALFPALVLRVHALRTCRDDSRRRRVEEMTLGMAHLRRVFGGDRVLVALVRRGWRGWWGCPWRIALGSAQGPGESAVGHRCGRSPRPSTEPQESRCNRRARTSSATASARTISL